MTIRRSKTDSTHGTFRDIPKQYRIKRMKRKKKYILYRDGRKHRIIAYSIREIAEHFDTEKSKLDRDIMMVNSFDGLDADINLCH